MTTKETIKILSREKECVQQALQKCADGSGYVSPDGMIRAADYVEACSVAIAALRAQQEQEDPKPLTLDELRQMDGEPVWLTGVEPEDTWARIDYVETLTIGFSLFGDSETWCFRAKHYGEIVFAYRHKPRGDA